MTEMNVEPSILIEAQAQEIARLTHRSLLAEAAVEQLQRQVTALLEMASTPDEQSAG